MIYMAAIVGAALLGQTPPDPQRMPFGRSGEAVVRVGEMLDMKTLKSADASDVARAARNTRFVYLGEGHANAEHHKLQASIIEALAKRRDVIVAFEMFQRPKQDDLNPWTLGWWTEDQFIERSEWKTQWGFDFALYRPIFEVVKRLKLPMVALNVPRDWVRSVGRKGLDGLTPEQRAQLPGDLELGWKDHKAVFTAMIGGHPMTGAMGDNMYAAQVLWDVGMGDSMLKYWDRVPRSSRTVMVVIAGAGHVMYGLGIDGRVAKRTGDKGIVVTMIEADGKATVSRGLGDFVYAASPAKSE